MSTNKLKVDLFGDGISINKGVFGEELLGRLQATAQKLKQPLELALTDPYLYHALKDKNIKSIKDIERTIINGLINTHKNRIEIWYKGQKVQKLTINSLNKDYLLFPLFQSKTESKTLENNSGFYIKNLEIGLIGQYEIMVENFSIDHRLSN